MLQAIALGLRGVLARPAQTCSEFDRDAETAARSGLVRLHSDFHLALLDDGEESALESEVERLDLQELVPFRVWTPRLGSLARPPRPLAFRWLANRWDVRPAHCLYVAGSDLLAEAARAAGWQVLPLHRHEMNLEALAERLESGARPWEC